MTKFHNPRLAQVCARNSSFTHIETTVRNGFPIVVFYRIGKAEPDVGYMQDYLDDYFFTTSTGTNVDFLRLTVREIEEILDAIPQNETC